jgi:hypothetical protein
MNVFVQENKQRKIFFFFGILIHKEKIKVIENRDRS